MRASWTDDRMYDLARHLDTGSTQVHEDIAALCAETHQDIAGLRADHKELRTTWPRSIAISELRSASWPHARNYTPRTLIAAILAGFVGLLATRFA